MNKTAIVLAGGGSRGAYQIGVWKALREMGIDYQLVTGTSVGALNGVLMVQQEYDKALAVWENISSQQVLGDMLELGEMSRQLHTLVGDMAAERIWTTADCARRLQRKH